MSIFQNETIWLIQKKMAELFDVQRPAITKHLKKIFESGEMDEQMVSSILEHTTQHGAIDGKTQTKETEYYNIDAIIAVGYRVNSKRATQFRIWATSILKEYIIKGFAMDDDRLKQSEHRHPYTGSTPTVKNRIIASTQILNNPFFSAGKLVSQLQQTAPYSVANVRYQNPHADTARPNRFGQEIPR